MMIHLSLDEAKALQAVRTMRISRNADGRLEVPDDIDRRAVCSLSAAGYLDDQGVGVVGLTASGAAVACPPLRQHLRAPRVGRAA